MADRKHRYPILARMEDEINRCFRCGLCKTVCPSFEETKREESSPRGRSQYARAALNGELPLKQAVESSMLDCLNCMRCADICPADVRTDRIVLAARAELAKRGRLHPLKKLAFNTVMRSARLLESASCLGGMAQRLLLRDSSTLETAAPLLAGMDDKHFPEPAERRFQGRLPEVNTPADDTAKLRVAYFVGCATNLLYPEVGEATVRVLTRNGCEVVIPRRQACCGIPVYSSGDFDIARSLAVRNLATFNVLEGIDCIVTDCASCSAALKHEVHEILGVEKFDVPVYDLNEFLVNRIDIDRSFGEVPMRATYHDPCHLKRGQGISDEPRALLTMVPGVDLIELEGADRCCGGAGTFAYTHHVLARKVGAHKTDAIRVTGADYVATPCPSCTMQLEDLLHHEGLAVNVIHPVEVLDRGYRAYDMAHGAEHAHTKNDTITIE